MDSFTVHGGRVDEARRRFPQAPEPWLDLSTGINPCAWDFDPNAVPDLRTLPSPDALAQLCQAAATAFGAQQIAVAALPGSEIGLRLLAHLGLPKPWRIVAPTYGTHGAALPGASVIAPDAMMQAAADGGTLLLANPNNPDGRVCPPDRLLHASKLLNAARGLLVVDEAFADATPAVSILPRLTDADRVLVFRSFGKFFGLAGVRLGFVCGARDAVSAIAQRLGSWPVSSVAIALGTAAYTDRPWMTQMQERLREECIAFDRLLRRHGVQPFGNCPLFRLVDTPDAGTLFQHLGRAGILTRPFEHAPNWLRIGLPGTPEANARLHEALRHR